MTPKANDAGQMVVLSQRVIATDTCSFDAEREIRLPIPPFVGLHLYRTVNQECGDGNEEEIIEVGFDLENGRVYCYLPLNDYRPEASGVPDFTEEDVLADYRDWKLKRNDPGKGKGNGFISDPL